MLKKWLVAVLGGAAIVLSTGALAQKQATQGFYVGGEVGSFDIDDESDTAFKILGGYQINRNFAVEAAYGFLFDKEVQGANFEVTAFEVVGVASFPIADKLSVYGKLGFAMWEVEASAFGLSASDDGTDLTFGLGLQYDLTPKLALRGQWQRYDVSDEDADLFSVGLIYRF
jgi:OOP family OmpA-OmpF porin